MSIPHGSLSAGVTAVTWATIIRQFGGARNASNAQACWEALHARGIIGTEMLFSPLRVFEGVVHGFYTLGKLIPEAREAVALSAATLRVHLVDRAQA